jgi:hypothetical protein
MNASVQANSNRPYNITTGFDDNHDGNTKARPPGVGRNTGIGPGFWNVNVNLQRTISLKKEKSKPASVSGFSPNMTVLVNFWNAFNTPQYPSYSGVMTSPFFGKPNRANNPRNIEAGMRLNF